MWSMRGTVWGYGGWMGEIRMYVGAWQSVCLHISEYLNVNSNVCVFQERINYCKWNDHTNDMHTVMDHN